MSVCALVPRKFANTNIFFHILRGIYFLSYLCNSTENAFIRVLVAVSYNLITLSQVIGWSYFVAWSISFYPQIIVNFQRKSVTGLNFDYLALNILGFILYGIFNVGLYSIPEIQVCFVHRFMQPNINSGLQTFFLC